MNTFDIIVQTKENFQGYEGNPPSDEADYNERKDTMFSGTAPTWSELQTEMDNYVSPQDSGNQKLLDLGLTQAEATALTGYTPPVAE
jgi:major membrane immunogen (membrane-anchored lipoprotein)